MQRASGPWDGEGATPGRVRTVAEIVLIVAGAWVAITVIVLAICRAAKRDDKLDDGSAVESRPTVGVASSAKTDGTTDRPPSQE